MSSRPRALKPRFVDVVDVTAVLVASDGAQWLPEALAALAASTVSPARVLCVDVGSTDGSVELLRAAHGAVLELPRGTGFGAAVATALARAPRTRWIWLLHDDAAVEPDALRSLLAYARASPSAVLLGPKVSDWDNPRLLVDVGLSCDPDGRRDTGLDHREIDQGQHDTPRAVLAVGTAGALIRRDVWDGVGGLDPSLPAFRDDLDLGWRVNAAGHQVVVVPTARVRHVRAATTGRRELPSARGRAPALDRRHAVFVLLAHATGPELLRTVPRLFAVGLLRAVSLLLARRPLAARDEAAALLAVLGQPGRLAAARRARALTRTVPPASLRSLLSPRRGWRDVAAGPADPAGAVVTASLRPFVARQVRRPGVLLTLALALVALVAERNVLAVRGGTLLGGGLLPAPPGASDLWSTYLAGWHPVSVGSGRAAAPATGLLAILSTLLFGKPWLAVDLLLLASVPLAGAVAYRASARLTRQRLPRLWAAAAWALLPVGTGAIAEGRLDSAVVQVALPPLLVAAAGLLSPEPRSGDDRQRAWAVGLGLGLTAAFAPVLWPLLVVLLLAGAAALRSGRAARAALVVAAAPALLLLPWSGGALVHPSRLLDGPGALFPLPPVPAWHLLLLSPGASPAVWVPLGVLLAGLSALVRRDLHPVALGGWVAAVVGLVAAVALRAGQHWPGVALQLAAAGMLTAALVGAVGARERLERRDFGWQQLTAGVVTACALLVPLGAAVAWLARGADGPLQRGVPPVLPAFASAELRSTAGLRVLVVRAVGLSVGYELTTAGGDRLGSADTPPAADQAAQLDAVVTDLLTPRGTDAAAALATRAVRYVALPAGSGSAALATALDAQPGLARRSDGNVLLWRVEAPTGHLTLLSPALAAAALRGSRGPGQDALHSSQPQPLATDGAGALAGVPPGPAGRLVVLAEAHAAGWRASLDGHPLATRTAWGWAQAFVLPAHGGRLTVGYDEGPRRMAVAAEGLVLLVLLALAGPGTRPLPRDLR